MGEDNEKSSLYDHDFDDPEEPSPDVTIFDEKKHLKREIKKNNRPEVKEEKEFNSKIFNKDFFDQLSDQKPGIKYPLSGKNNERKPQKEAKETDEEQEDNSAMGKITRFVKMVFAFIDKIMKELEKMGSDLLGRMAEFFRSPTLQKIADNAHAQEFRKVVRDAFVSDNDDVSMRTVTLIERQEDNPNWKTLSKIYKAKRDANPLSVYTEEQFLKHTIINIRKKRDVTDAIPITVTLQDLINNAPTNAPPLIVSVQKKPSGKPNNGELEADTKKPDTDIGSTKPADKKGEPEKPGNTPA